MQQAHEERTRPHVRIGSMMAAAVFLLAAMFSGYRYIGWPPVIIRRGLRHRCLCIVEPHVSPSAFDTGTRSSCFPSYGRGA